MNLVITVLVAALIASTLLTSLLSFRRNSLIENAQLAAERARLDAQERLDRIIEALARQARIDIQLPAPKSVRLEESPGWFDIKPKVTVVVPPVKGKEKTA